MKGKSTKSSRLKLAIFLNQHLRSFGTAYENVVICPTCLSELNLSQDERCFTAGHILPEAAGGKEWTFLCRKCNSRFGENQDKWFGEYLDILCNPTGTILHAKTKRKYINVNGENIRAEISISEPDKGIDIFLPINLNPPGKVQNIVLGSRPQFSVKIPLIEHENEVEIGYVTAAYLYWFQEIGYNWIFQSSLDVVRKQILECDRQLDGAKVIDLNTDKLDIQGIGVIKENNVVYPCCVVVDKLVIFPAPSTIAAPTPKNTTFSSLGEIKFLTLKIMESPYLVFYDGGPVVVPDMLIKHPPIPELLLYIHPDQDKEPQWLTLQTRL